MVRLLHFFRLLLFGFLYLFQSHNGAIAARTTLQERCVTHWFQSHNGAIAAKAKFGVLGAE